MMVLGRYLVSLNWEAIYTHDGPSLTGSEAWAPCFIKGL